MKATVIERFVDKMTGIQREVGETIELNDKSRISNLVERKLIKVAESVALKEEEKTSSEASATPKKSRKRDGVCSRK